MKILAQIGPVLRATWLTQSLLQAGHTEEKKLRVETGPIYVVYLWRSVMTLNTGFRAPNIHICLASQSPRRREMLAWLNVPFRVTSADVDEQAHEGEAPRDLASRLARLKAHAIPTVSQNEWVLAADTIVELQSQPLGKPQTSAEARTMLLNLRDQQHQVHTAIALFNPRQGQLSTQCVTTQVWMRPYTEAEIADYIASGDPMDKAGAYAIQNSDFNPVARLEYCYANVVGLPLCSVAKLLRGWGHPPSVNIPALCQQQFAYPCPINGGIAP